MADPYPQFTHLTKHLQTLKLAYLHVVEPRMSGHEVKETADKIDFMTEIWGRTSPFLVAGALNTERAQKLVDDYPNNDMVAVFGRPFIPNPDLVFRIKEGISFTKYDRDTFYVSFLFLNTPHACSFEHPLTIS